MTRIGPILNPERGTVLETPGGTRYTKVPTNESERKMASVDGNKPPRSALTAFDRTVIAICVSGVGGLAAWALGENITNGRDIAAIKADSRNSERRAEATDRRLDNIDQKLDRLLERRP